MLLSVEEIQSSELQLLQILFQNRQSIYLVFFRFPCHRSTSFTYFRNTNVPLRSVR